MAESNLSKRRRHEDNNVSLSSRAFSFGTTESNSSTVLNRDWFQAIMTALKNVDSVRIVQVVCH